MMMRRFLHFGLGALCLTRDRAEKIMSEMTDKEDAEREDTKRYIDEAVKRGIEEKEELRRMVKQEYEEIKSQVSLVSKKDYDALEARVKALEEKMSGE